MATSWTPVPASRAWEMLNIVPPALQNAVGFLVGEPMSHRTCRVTGKAYQPTYAAFAEGEAGAWEADEALTRAEFREVTLADVARNTVRRAM